MTQVKEALKYKGNDNADYIEIRDLVYIWESLPLKGKMCYEKLSEDIYQNQLAEVFQIPRVLYSEYVLEIEYLEQETGEEYGIISEDEYNRLSLEDYIRVMGILLPKKKSPYVLFCQDERNNIKNEYSRFNVDLSFGEIGGLLNQKWSQLPEKGKNDY